MFTSSGMRSIAFDLVVAVIVLGTLTIILTPFASALGWALIVTLLSWPIFNRLCRLGIRESIAAGIVILLSIVFAFGVCSPVFRELSQELFQLGNIQSILPRQSIDYLLSIPIVSEALNSPHVQRLAQNALSASAEVVFSFGSGATRSIAHFLFTGGMALFLTYFLLIHGAKLGEDLRSILLRYDGARLYKLLVLSVDTIRGVAQGACVTALAQGVLAGLGFFVAGARLPMILGLATAIMSFVPFGAPFVYLPVIALLIIEEGAFATGILLLLWCVLVVSTADNILRPLLISKGLKVSMPIVFLGVIGGILAFGLIGLFIGPVIVVICQVLWRELADASRRDVTS